MYYRKTQDDGGAYIDGDGVRFAVAEVRNVRPTDGWTRFSCMEKCLEAWHLTYDPVPAPVVACMSGLSSLRKDSNDMTTQCGENQ